MSDLHEIGNLGVWSEIESVAQNHVIPLDHLVEDGPRKAIFHDSFDIPPALAAVPVCLVHSFSESAHGDFVNRQASSARVCYWCEQNGRVQVIA